MNYRYLAKCKCGCYGTMSYILNFESEYIGLMYDDNNRNCKFTILQFKSLNYIKEFIKIASNIHSLIIIKEILDNDKWMYLPC
mgnify:CR=1 FL=1